MLNFLKIFTEELDGNLVSRVLLGTFCPVVGGLKK